MRCKLWRRASVLSVAAVVASLWLSGAARAEDQPLSLRPAWQAGQTAVYEFWNQRQQTTAVTFNANTRETQLLVTTEGHTRWTVDKANADGSYTCTMTLEWMVATFEAEGKKQVNDSRKPTGEIEPVHKLLRAMVAVPLTITVNSDGSIAEAHGTDRMKSNIGKDLEELIPKPLDFVESASELATLTFVPQSVAPGETYKAQYRWTHEMGHTDQAWTYTVVGAEELEGIPVVTVTGTGAVKLDVDRSEIPADAPPIDIRMVRGEGATQVFYDVKRREAVGRHSTHTERVLVSITLPQGRGKVDRTIDKTIQSQVLRIATQ